MLAEIIFMETEDHKPVIKRLRELGFELEVLNWDFGDGERDITVTATTITDLEDVDFFRRVQAIVGPLGGTVTEAGLVSSPFPGFA
jgi:hypothetical protein